MQSRKTGCDVWSVPEAKGHPVLKGLENAKFHSPSWIYRQNPLEATTTSLMAGRWSKKDPDEPVAFVNTFNGARVFYTTLGHWDDFKIPEFNTLLRNGIYWAAGKEPK